MRYFPKIAIAEVVERFGIPKQTAYDWQKREEREDWRGGLIDKLRMFTFLQNEALKKLKVLFTKKEMMALWGSLKSTMITAELVENKDYLKFGFADYCEYESMEAAQFGEVLILCKSVCDKLDALDMFERYCLLEFIINDKNEIFS